MTTHSLTVHGNGTAIHDLVVDVLHQTLRALVQTQFMGSVLYI